MTNVKPSLSLNTSTKCYPLWHMRGLPLFGIGGGGETPSLLSLLIINNNKEALLQLVDHPRVNLDLSMDDIKDLVVNTFGGTSQEERIEIARLVF